MMNCFPLIVQGFSQGEGEKRIVWWRDEKTLFEVPFTVFKKMSVPSQGHFWDTEEGMRKYCILMQLYPNVNKETKGIQTKCKDALCLQVYIGVITKCQLRQQLSFTDPV